MPLVLRNFQYDILIPRNHGAERVLQISYTSESFQDFSNTTLRSRYRNIQLVRSGLRSEWRKKYVFLGKKENGSEVLKGK